MIASSTTLFDPSNFYYNDNPCGLVLCTNTYLSGYILSSISIATSGGIISLSSAELSAFNSQNTCSLYFVTCEYCPSWTGGRASRYAYLYINPKGCLIACLSYSLSTTN